MQPYPNNDRQDTDSQRAHTPSIQPLALFTVGSHTPEASVSTTPSTSTSTPCHFPSPPAFCGVCCVCMWRECSAWSVTPCLHTACLAIHCPCPTPTALHPPNHISHPPTHPQRTQRDTHTQSFCSLPPTHGTYTATDVVRHAEEVEDVGGVEAGVFGELPGYHLQGLFVGVWGRVVWWCECVCWGGGYVCESECVCVLDGGNGRELGGWGECGRWVGLDTLDRIPFLLFMHVPWRRPS